MLKKILEIGYTEQAIAMEAKAHQPIISRILTVTTLDPNSKYLLICHIKIIFSVYGAAIQMTITALMCYAKMVE